MESNPLTAGIKDTKIHMVGVKGVGMTALAEILQSRGALVSGSDSAEVFFTDAILARLGIVVCQGFADTNIPAGTALVIYSAAYLPSDNAELLKAAKACIPMLSYPEALGALSGLFFSVGVCGVHGKTTTTAMAGIMARHLELNATTLVGSEVPQFGNRSTSINGDNYFIAETCEYKRHFLHFHPSVLVLTSVEEDHQDYYKNLADIQNAFVEYIGLLPADGTVFFCADDPGAVTVCERAQEIHTGIRFIPYGFFAQGAYQLTDFTVSSGETSFRLSGYDQLWRLKVPGRHMAMDATAAIALGMHLYGKQNKTIDPAALSKAAAALAGFRGTRRRSEIIGESRGILFMDDYAHHPTAIRTTLAGIREYYPDRRIIVDFMSHTYSRTRALLADFAGSFRDAHEVIVHKIYASARENFDGSVSGETLAAAIKQNKERVVYFNEVMDAFDFLKTALQSGDLFITMGAGDNWKLAHKLYHHLKDNS